MNRRTFNAFCGLGLPLGLLGVAPAVRAQSWPDKPVRLILSQAAGSGPDNVARVLAERLSRQWGQQVVIENKPGGQNIIGAQASARAPADGYTFYLGTAAALVTNPHLFKQLPYDPLKDFEAVAFVSHSPFGVIVPANSPIRTIDELVARSKSRPGQFSIGNEGPRTFGGMVARLLNARTQAEANLVAYVSPGVLAQDLLGGHVDAIVTGVASVSQLVQQGRLRVLATVSTKRVPGFEEVPTLSELLKGMDMVGWLAVVAPTGTPKAVIERVNRDINALLADRDVAGRLTAIGQVVESGQSVEQLGGFLRTEHARWAQLTREIGVLPE